MSDEQADTVRRERDAAIVALVATQATIAELRRERDALKADAQKSFEIAMEVMRERDALRTLAGNIYALMIERNEDDCAFVDPAAVQDEIRAECRRLGVFLCWARPAPATDGGGDSEMRRLTKCATARKEIEG